MDLASCALPVVGLVTAAILCLELSVFAAQNQFVLGKVLAVTVLGTYGVFFVAATVLTIVFTKSR